MIHSLLISKDSYGAPMASEYHQLPDNYDGDPYGDTVPFSVGSNQYISTYDTESEAKADKVWLDSANDADEDAEHRAFLVWLDRQS